MAILLIALGAFILTWLLIAAFQPAEFRTSRRLLINAPAETLFDEVNDPRKFNTWSPFVEADPAATITYDGPAEGVGASMSWAGKRCGAGTSTITESQKPARVIFRLDFTKPMKATNTAEFLFVPAGSHTTEVEWVMYGKNNFIGKMFGVFINCDRMVGKMFERGLHNLKAKTEGK